ncbi:MAG: hypothetical protein PHW96_03495 [Candidatus Nanoarchaeia archaeon]|nr:hypothetical protein [Candidatus Nanoarchaeia archaeon]
MVNYIEDKIECIKNKKLKHATKVVFDTVTDAGYIISGIEPKIEFVRVNYGECVASLLEEIFFDLEFPEDENYNKHNIKIEFEKYYPHMCSVQEDKYFLVILLSGSAKHYLKNPECLSGENIIAVPYKTGLFKKEDKEFPSRLKHALEAILEKEKKSL